MGAIINTITVALLPTHPSSLYAYHAEWWAEIHSFKTRGPKILNSSRSLTSLSFCRVRWTECQTWRRRQGTRKDECYERPHEDEGSEQTRDIQPHQVSTHHVLCFCLRRYLNYMVSVVNREVFKVDGSTHAPSMEQVKQNVLEGTSNWSAKLAITGNIIHPTRIVLQTATSLFFK